MELEPSSSSLFSLESSQLSGSSRVAALPPTQFLVWQGGVQFPQLSLRSHCHRGPGWERQLLHYLRCSVNQPCDELTQFILPQRVWDAILGLCLTQSKTKPNRTPSQHGYWLALVPWAGPVACPGPWFWGRVGDVGGEEEGSHLYVGVGMGRRCRRSSFSERDQAAAQSGTYRPVSPVTWLVWNSRHLLPEGTAA